MNRVLAEPARVSLALSADLRPDQLSAMVMEIEEVVISPPWSVHMGSGTRDYTFIWVMAGENLVCERMGVQDICQLR